MHCFLVVLEPGAGREHAKGRRVSYSFDDEVHRLVHSKLRYIYFDRWGGMRMRVTHMPLIRLIVGPALTGPGMKLQCLNGDRFDYQRHNWVAKA